MRLLSVTLLALFAQAAAQIQSLEGGRVSAVFWNLTDATEEDFQRLGQAGFNEVIVDGHRFAQGLIPMEAAARQVAAARRAGIVSFKFVRGSPGWAGPERAAARAKIAQLAGRISHLKAALRAQGEGRAADALRGIVVNVEPYARKGWSYDFSDYVAMHDELERIAQAQGLSYETFDAFWIGEPVHESGNRMTGYLVRLHRTTYMMSYRRDAYDAFQIAGFFATRVPHVAGFDLVSGGEVGFREHPEDLPQAVADYVELTFSQTERKRGFRGIFVNASRVQDLLAFLRNAGQKA